MFRTLAVVLALSPLAAAGGLLVNSTLDLPDADVLDGVCDADLATPGLQITLRAAVQHANVTPGADSIEIPAGTYKLTVKGSGEDAAATGDLDLVEDVSLAGDSPETTIIDGKKVKDRLFEVFPAATVTMSGLTLRRGFANQEQLGGGAIRVDGVLHLSNAIVRKNRSVDDAGGVEFSDAHVGPSTLDDVVFEKNKAADDGAGVDIDGGELDVARCTFAKNHAGDEGGAFESSDATAVFVNCTFSGNVGKFDGGAINVEEGGDVTLLHCTLAKNKSQQGAGLSVQDGLTLGTDAVVHNTIFDNAPKNNCAGTMVSGGGNIDTGTTCALNAALDQSSVPHKSLLLPLADNGGLGRTHMLKPGSPALDAADDAIAALVGEDQRGLPRPVDIAGTGVSAGDIGALEVQADEVAP